MGKTDIDEMLRNNGFGGVPQAIMNRMAKYNVYDLMMIYAWFEDRICDEHAENGEVAIVEAMEAVYARFKDLTTGECGFVLLGLALSLIATFFNIDETLRLHEEINDIENGGAE